jgi:hypothetical protein
MYSPKHTCCSGLTQSLSLPLLLLLLLLLLLFVCHTHALTHSLFVPSAFFDLILASYSVLSRIHVTHVTHSRTTQPLIPSCAGARAPPFLSSGPHQPTQQHLHVSRECVNNLQMLNDRKRLFHIPAFKYVFGARCFVCLFVKCCSQIVLM